MARTVLIDINHPAHVHFFKNAYFELKKQGHNVVVTATLKEMNYSLMDRLGIDYIDLGFRGKSIFTKVLNVPLMAFKIARIVNKYKPDILMGIASYRICHGTIFTKCKKYIFTDTEHATEQILLFKPFATNIFTPDCFTKDLGKKQVKYSGYHELAYLHPNRFKPDPSILGEIGLSPTSRFFILRFVSWGASHDIGHSGIKKEQKLELIQLLQNYGKVFISSESSLPSELQPYQLDISYEKIHHLLYYASLIVTEGATMASESALLGTPAIFVSTLKLGYLNDLVNNGLVYHFKNNKRLIVETEEVVKRTLESDSYQQKTQQLIATKIDVTDYMVDLVNEL